MAATSRPRRTSRTAATTPTTRVTIHDVAASAGVSIGTVSRALNDRNGVSQQTRVRVLRAVEALGYSPDRAARELSNRQPVRVALNVAHGYRRLTPFAALFLQHLNQHLAASGLFAHDVDSGSDGLPHGDADAFVLLGAHPDDPRLDHLMRRGVPFVLVGHHPGVRCVAPDDVQGGRLAAEHLLRLGHHEPLHLTATPHSQVFADRRAGFDEALGAAGHAPAGVLTADEASALHGYRAMRAHLESGARPSAVFAATDELAQGAITAAGDLNLRVPDDISVIGFDDLPEIGADLTTIRQDIDALASETVTLLHEALARAPVRAARLPVRLVSRGTTAERR